MTQIELAIVFEAVKEFPHDATAAKSRDGAIEMQMALLALMALKFARNRAFERLGALPTKGRLDFQRLTGAPGAEMHARGRFRLALRAVWRVNRVENGINDEAQSVRDFHK
jgi:hypothetical protein